MEWKGEWKRRVREGKGRGGKGREGREGSMKSVKPRACKVASPPLRQQQQQQQNSPL